MSEESTGVERSRRPPYTDRRRLLAAIGATAGVGGLAGCGDGGGESGDGGGNDDTAVGTRSGDRATDAAGTPADHPDLRGRFDALESRLPDLEAALNEAAESDLAIDYERVDATVVERFVDYGREDVDNGRIERARYVAEECERLLSEAMDDLERSIAGEREPFTPPRYRTSQPQITGQHFEAETRTHGESGTATRPTFFDGYGHFRQVREDVPNFQDFGTNAIQIQVRPRDTLADFVDGEFRVDTSILENRVTTNLERAARNDVAVSLLLAPHVPPEWFAEEFPELQVDQIGFFGYNVFHPTAKAMIEAHTRAVMEHVAEFDSLHSITLSNEPMYHQTDDPQSREGWRRYLADRYDSTGELNATYGADYDDFGAVPQPDQPTQRWNPTNVVEDEPSPRLYDWAQFNNERFAEWHAWLADVVHDVAPDVPVHAKINQRALRTRQSLLTHGVDPERFCRLSDLNGCDNSAYLIRQDEAVAPGDQRGIREYLKFYDLLASMGDQPIFDSEGHLIWNGNDDYVPEQRKHVRTAVWQGAVHGRSAHTMWIWRRTYDEDSGSNNSILHRPDCVATKGKTALDMNRLGGELVALQNAEAGVAILYSLGAHLYSRQYLEAIDVAYETLAERGPVDFVSERQIADGRLADYDLLIAPAATHVERDAAAGIAEYAAAGGSILGLGSGVLSRDTKDRELPSGIRQRIADGTSTVAIDEAESALADALDRHDLQPVTVSDTAADSWPDHLEVRWAEHDGRRILNVANYNRDSRTIDVEWDGSVRAATDLLTGDDVESPITVPGLTPMVLDLDR